MSKTKRIRMLTSIAGTGFSYGYNQVVDHDAAESERLVKSGQAEFAQDATLTFPPTEPEAKKPTTAPAPDESKSDGSSSESDAAKEAAAKAEADKLAAEKKAAADAEEAAKKAAVKSETKPDAPAKKGKAKK